MEALEQRVIKLRPHHLVVIFLEYIHIGEEELKETLLGYKFTNGIGYSPAMVDNLLLVNRDILIEGKPIILAPSMDDICGKCNRRKEDKYVEEKCLQEDDPLVLNAVNSTFDMRYGSKSNPLHLLFTMKTLYREFVSVCQLSNQAGAGFYEARLRNYERFYEKLKNNGGN